MLSIFVSFKGSGKGLGGGGADFLLLLRATFYGREWSPRENQALQASFCISSLPHSRLAIVRSFFVLHSVRCLCSTMTTSRRCSMQIVIFGTADRRNGVIYPNQMLYCIKINKDIFLNKKIGCKNIVLHLIISKSMCCIIMVSKKPDGKDFFSPSIRFFSIFFDLRYKLALFEMLSLRCGS